MHQDFFWSLFDISQNSFKQILSFNNVSSRFLDFVHAYDKKKNEDENFFDGHYRTIFAESNSEKPSHFGNFINY